MTCGGAGAGEGGAGGVCEQAGGGALCMLAGGCWSKELGLAG